MVFGSVTNFSTARGSGPEITGALKTSPSLPLVGKVVSENCFGIREREASNGPGGSPTAVQGGWDQV